MPKPKKTSLYKMLNVLLIFAILPLFFTLSACESDLKNVGGQEYERPEKQENEATIMPPKTNQKAESVDLLLDGLLRRLEAQPEDVEGWVLLAKSYQYLGRLDEAKQALEKAEKLGYSGFVIDEENSSDRGQISQPRHELPRSSNFVHEPIFELMEGVASEQAPVKNE